MTDRDLRTRVLAAGRSGGTRIDAAMTVPVFTVAPDRLGAEVLYEMLERGIRHAPVVSERGKLVGVLEDADLFAAQPRSWFGIRRLIDRARNVDALAEVGERLPGLMLDLHRSSVAPLELARVLSALVDALTRRALEVALPRAELPTEGIVWVAVGSQARRELTLASSRRGALVCSRPPPAPWLAALEPALARCGIDGPVTARDVDGWTRAAAGDELALSVLADRRALWGTPTEPLPTADGVSRARLLDALAVHAFTHSPPTGFEADTVLRLDGRRSDRLNIRLAAVVPIAALGRWAAAVAGSEEVSTPERLRAAADAGVLGAEQAMTLAEAFELALELQDRASPRVPGGRPRARRPARPGGDEPADPRAPAGRLPGRQHGRAGATPLRMPARRHGAAQRYHAARWPAAQTPWREAEWCAVDLELTGLDRADEIIAIGAVPVKDGRLILGEAMYTLARPRQAPKHAAVLIHKLRSADLAAAPAPDEAIDLLLGVLAGRVPVFHTAMVERSFLGRELRRRRVRLPADADTEALGRLWLRERDGVAPAGLSLAGLARVLGQPAEPPHHALGDALTTAAAFIALASHLDAVTPQTVGSLQQAERALGGARRFGPG